MRAVTVMNQNRKGTGMTMDILERTILLKPDQSKTNVRIPFEVPQGLTEMTIEYSYSPKELADREKALRLIDEGMERYATAEYRDHYDPAENYLPVVNLVTLSLDGPDGYRGCAHRHAPVQIHRLSADEASPGFLPGAITAGSWEAVINVHAVVTEQCAVRLKVTGEGETR